MATDEVDVPALAPWTRDEIIAALRRAMDTSRHLQARAVALVSQSHRLVAGVGRPQGAGVARLQQRIAALERALGSRAVIDQAIGMVMASTGRDAESAFQLLVEQSQFENRKLRDVAADVVQARDHRDASS
jgi:hypothetical protein